jgi:hypothetical protein
MNNCEERGRGMEMRIAKVIGSIVLLAIIPLYSADAQIKPDWVDKSRAAEAKRIALQWYIIESLIGVEYVTGSDAFRQARGKDHIARIEAVTLEELTGIPTEKMAPIYESNLKLELEYARYLMAMYERGRSSK